MAKSTRIFKPGPKSKEEHTEKAKLENKGRTFKPPQAKLEEQKQQQEYYEATNQNNQYYEQEHQESGFNQGTPAYLNYPQENSDLEDDFSKFQYENEQLEILNAAHGEFGENVIRFEESSRNCECCQGLVERCDGDICETLGECYCVAHNSNKG